MRSVTSGFGPWTLDFRLLLLSVCIAATVVQGQQALSLQANVAPDEITLGGRATLTLSLTHPEGGEVGWPEPKEGFAPFEVLDFRILDPVAGEQGVQSQAEYVLTAFELGELQIPALEVRWMPEGGDALTLKSDPLTVKVASLQPDEQAGIRDIKPPLGIPRNWWIVAGWGAAAAGLAALAFWAIRRYLRRPPIEKPLPTRVVPDRPPHEVALEALAKLESSPLLERGQIKQYYVEVSEIVRIYLEGRFGIVAMEMTSSEVLQQLEGKRLGLKQMEPFRDFFSRCDLVKFAKLRPGIEPNKEIVPLARRLVEETKEEEVHAEAQRRREAEKGKEKAALASVSSAALWL